MGFLPRTIGTMGGVCNCAGLIGLPSANSNGAGEHISSLRRLKPTQMGGADLVAMVPRPTFAE